MSAATYYSDKSDGETEMQYGNFVEAEYPWTGAFWLRPLIFPLDSTPETAVLVSQND